MRYPHFFVWTAVLVLLSSCFGMTSAISLKSDGSGSIEMEYRISKAMLKLGTLDGNEAYPAVPVGEADFKRTIDQIEGLSLKKFAGKEDGEDLVYRVTIEFTGIPVLMSFLGTQGQHCDLAEKDGKQVLTIVFSPGNEAYDQGMLELIPVIFDGYQYELRISLPKKYTAVFTYAGKKQDEPAVGAIKRAANSVTFSAPMGVLLACNEPVTLELSW